MPATEPTADLHAAPEVMACPMTLSLLWHAGAKTEPDELIDMGEDAQAKQILIRELIHWLVESWPRAKHAAKVLSLGIEIGEKLCQKR